MNKPSKTAAAALIAPIFTVTIRESEYGTLTAQAGFEYARNVRPRAYENSRLTRARLLRLAAEVELLSFAAGETWAVCTDDCRVWIEGDGTKAETDRAAKVLAQALK